MKYIKSVFYVIVIVFSLILVYNIYSKYEEREDAKAHEIALEKKQEAAKALEEQAAQRKFREEETKRQADIENTRLIKEQIQRENAKIQADIERQKRIESDNEAIKKMAELAIQKKEQRKAEQEQRDQQVEIDAANIIPLLKDKFYNNDGTLISTNRKTWDDTWTISTQAHNIINTTDSRNGPNYKILLDLYTAISPVITDALHKKIAWDAYVATLNDPQLKAAENRKIADAKIRHEEDMRKLEAKIKQREANSQRQQAIHDAALPNTQQLGTPVQIITH